MFRGQINKNRVYLLLGKKATMENLIYYSNQAKIIQKFFRGFHSRKYVHHFKKRVAHIRELHVKNERMLKSLHLYHRKMTESKKFRDLNYAQTEFRKIVKNLHHLKSTDNIPGIFNSPFAKMKPKAFGVDLETHLNSNFKADY